MVHSMLREKDAGQREEFIAALDGYLAKRFGQPVKLAADVFQPVTPVAMALRILNNLRNVYLGHGDTAMAAQVLDLMLVVTPDSALLWQERGVLAYRDADWEAAARALRSTRSTSASRGRCRPAFRRYSGRA